MKKIILKTILLGSALIAVILALHYKPITRSSVVKNREAESTEIFPKTQPARPAVPHPLNLTTTGLKAGRALQKNDRSMTATQKIVHEEARRLYNQIDNPELLDRQIKEQALHLNNEELNELVKITVDSSQNVDERIAAVYFLKMAGINAHKQLQEVVFYKFELQGSKPPVHSIQAAIIHHEHSLRTIALLALEENIQSTHGRLTTKEFKSQKINDPYLNSLLELVSVGERARQPLLKHLMDKNLG